MSLHVDGLVPKDEKWKKMEAAWDACEAAGVEVPDEVSDFFDGERPKDDELGRSMNLDRDADCCCQWNDGRGRAGFTVALADVPEQITHLRFYASY